MSGDYPFLELFWTMVIFFAWVSSFWLLIRCFSDVFRRRELGGGGKLLWTVLLIGLPFVGVFVTSLRIWVGSSTSPDSVVRTITLRRR